MISMTASASVRSRRPLRKARFVKFSRFCWSCPFAKGQPQDFFQRFPSAMALDFHHVFSRVGMGARHIDCQDLIHIDTLPVMDMTILQITGTGRGKGFFARKIRLTRRRLSGPLTRMMPTAPTPRAVAMALIVSSMIPPKSSEQGSGARNVQV